MAKCPFATQRPISGSSGAYVGGPFRIVHHSSEGSTAAAAMAAYAANKADPHFTVDRTTIFQHIDTGVGARALRNAAGGVPTNRLSAIQLELVGFAGMPKSKAALANVARLCRWIEATHGVPKAWPAGPPRPAGADGKDPGGHNRSAAIWSAEGGHYGHCHVPGNIHWDPAYSAIEVEFLMNATFDAAGTLANAASAHVLPLLNSAPTPAMGAAAAHVMADHFDVGEEVG